MTERLYRSDSFLSTFSARVVENQPAGSGSKVVLDRTAFYAAAGGQPCDFGTLGGAPVIDVAERADGAITHTLGSLLNVMPGGAVEGVVDFKRRFDYMQQHSGQHLLSQAFLRAAGAETLSVHFGDDASAIDVDAPALSPAQLDAVEDEVNRAVQANLAVIVREVPDTEVGAFGLRKPPKVTGLVRIVEFEGYDWSACGGTHVARSGQVGLVKLTRAEKRRGGTRVTFLCGNRALAHYRALNAQALILSERLSVSALDLPPAIDRMREEGQSLRSRLTEALDALAVREAAELRAAGQRRGEETWVIAAFQDREPEALRGLARRLIAEPRTVALLATGGAASFFCFSRAADASPDMAGLLRAALARLGARGGGSATYAQGGGPAATLEDIRAILGGLAPA